MFSHLLEYIIASMNSWYVQSIILHPYCRRGSDSERQVRKKRRPRDFDDEDYEEPLPPRRVSARKSAQAAAAADMARKGGFIRNQMDKRGSAPNKKMQRVDSMQYGVCSCGTEVFSLFLNKRHVHILSFSCPYVCLSKLSLQHGRITVSVCSELAG